MAVGLCWLPLRHPHARPSSSTLPGHDTPNPSTHSQQPDPGCVDHPVAPHCHPNTMVQTGGKTPRSQVPSGPAAIDTITPTAPNAVTTPPPPCGLGGHPWSYNASSLVFFWESAKQQVCPSPGYQHQGGAPSHVPCGYHHRYTRSTETDPCGSRHYSVDPRFPPPY